MEYNYVNWTRDNGIRGQCQKDLSYWKWKNSNVGHVDLCVLISQMKYYLEWNGHWCIWWKYTLAVIYSGKKHVSCFKFVQTTLYSLWWTWKINELAMIWVLNVPTAVIVRQDIYTKSWQTSKKISFEKGHNSNLSSSQYIFSQMASRFSGESNFTVF